MSAIPYCRETPLSCDVDALVAMTADEMHDFLAAKYGDDYESREFGEVE